MMKVPIYDLTIKDASERALILDRIDKVLSHGQLIMGEEVDEFEKKIAEYCGRKYAIGVGSGSDALLLGLSALGLKPGDEVITTSLSWIATANAIALTGATPVFADINDDLNIDVAAIESLICEKTKAILFVDFTGRMCDIDALLEISEHHNLHLIEDGSQAFGATYKGRRCGSTGILSAISHNPMKTLSACGEAGTVLCDDLEIRERIRALRHNGVQADQLCIQPSINGRLDTFQAAILIDRLENIGTTIANRKYKASIYDQLLSEFVSVPVRSGDREEVYYSYTIRSSRREELKQYLEDNGVETKVYHSPLMPLHPAYKGRCKANFSNALKIVGEILSLPISESVSVEQCEYVSEKIIEFGDSRPV